MNPESKTPDAPAPQLPNIPISPDDPFQPDLERQVPVTPPPPDLDSDPAPPRLIPGCTKKESELDPDAEQ